MAFGWKADWRLAGWRIACGRNVGVSYKTLLNKMKECGITEPKG